MPPFLGQGFTAFVEEQVIERRWKQRWRLRREIAPNGSLKSLERYFASFGVINVSNPVSTAKVKFSSYSCTHGKAYARLSDYLGSLSPFILLMWSISEFNLFHAGRVPSSQAPNLHNQNLNGTLQLAAARENSATGHSLEHEAANRYNTQRSAQLATAALQGTS